MPGKLPGVDASVPGWPRRAGLFGIASAVGGMILSLGLFAWGRVTGSVSTAEAFAPMFVGVFVLFGVMFASVGYSVWLQARGRA